jgi:hypothetical protein
LKSTGAAEAKHLPESATITIRNQAPDPSGIVEVTPKGGRVHFENQDDKEYRLRLYKPKTKALEGIDILLPARGRATVIIKRHDAFLYIVMDPIDEVATGKGGGPITN